jgi:hypothetical protein
MGGSPYSFFLKAFTSGLFEVRSSAHSYTYAARTHARTRESHTLTLIASGMAKKETSANYHHQPSQQLAG